MNCKKCDKTAIDLSIRSLKDIPNGPKWLTSKYLCSLAD